MPSGRVHSSTNAVLGIGVLFLVRPIETAFLVSMGCFLGVIVSPDLDVDGGYIGFWMVDKVLGRWIGKLWRGYWWPYGKILPHRSFLSHFPIVSTFFRCLYLFCPFFIVFLTIFPEFRTINWIFPLFWGMVLVDSVHWAMDILSTNTKRFLRRF